MKLKDLPPEQSLEGIRIRTPEGQEGYWVSQWNKGVWIRKTTSASEDPQVHPIFVDSLQECMDWDVIL